MAKGISIPIGGDAGDFSRAVETGVIRPLEEVERAVKDVGKGGGLDKLEDSMRDAQKATKNESEALSDLKRNLKESQKAARDFGVETDSSGNAIGRGYRKGAGEASEAVGTFKDEAKSNLSEVASSFDGSAQSITDLFQGTLGGVVQDLGPLGIAAGAAGAAGIGLIASGIQNAQEKQEAFRQKVHDLAQDMIETGSTGEVSYGHISDQLKSLATDADDLGVDLRKLNNVAEDAGGSFKDLAQAYVGNSRGLDKLIDKHREEQAELIKSNHANGESASSYEGANSKKIQAEADYLKYLEKARDAVNGAREEQKLYVESGAADLQAAADAQQSYADAVQSAYQEAGADVESFVQNGKFNLDDYQAHAEASLTAIKDYQGNMAKAQAELAQGGHDEAIQYLEQLGPDAAPLIAAFVNAPAAQRNSLAALWDGLGGTASGSFNSGLQSNLNKTPTTKSVSVYADLSSFNASMAEATRQRSVHIKAYTDAPRGVQAMGAP